MDVDITEAQRARAKKGLVWGLAIAALLGVSGGVIYLSLRLAGPINTIIYVFLFLFGLSFMPTSTVLGVGSMSAKVGKILGRLYFIFGQVSFGVGFLVQLENRYVMRPGRRTADGFEVWLDDKWQSVGGEENISVLGWMPFGVVRNKSDDTWDAYRVDPASLVNSDIVSDGGSTTTRAGFEEVRPDAKVSGSDGEWLVDLKRLWTRGWSKVGDIELIEKAEEIMMRKEAKSSRTGGWEPIIGMTLGLIIGVMVGYVMLGGG